MKMRKKFLIGGGTVKNLEDIEIGVKIMQEKEKRKKKSEIDLYNRCEIKLVCKGVYTHRQCLVEADTNPLAMAASFSVLLSLL